VFAVQSLLASRLVAADGAGGNLQLAEFQHAARVQSVQFRNPRRTGRAEEEFQHVHDVLPLLV